MNLKIEGGFLLKPYAASYTRKGGGGHKIRKGWTPDRTPEMSARFAELKAEGSDVPDFLLWKKVEHERGEQLARRKRPYPGWFPIGPRSDKAISRAYRKLFLRMNPGSDRRVRVGGIWSGPKTIVPPDGDYIFEGGVMRPVTDEHGLTEQDLKEAFGVLKGGRLRGVTIKVEK